MSFQVLSVKKDQIKKGRLSLCLLTIASLLTACSCSTRAIGQPDLGHLMRRAHGAVSIGMPIEDAKFQMEKLGFECEIVENGTIMFTDVTHPDVAMIENANFLKCIGRGRTGLIASAVRIQLLIEDGRVKKIYEHTSTEPSL